MSDDLMYVGVCPVCGEGFTDGFEDLDSEEITGWICDSCGETFR